MLICLADLEFDYINPYDSSSQINKEKDGSKEGDAGLNRSRRRLVRHRCRLDAKRKMAIKFLDWYLKIAVGSALIGGSMELFMIKTGFYDKVTVLESEKRAWENSPEAQAMREALNPWRNHDAQERKSS
ncbi:hypothetical protein V6N12_048039 [Hibiscus sabdariffa]